MKINPPQSDIDEILKRNAEYFSTLKEAQIILTGASGFIGTWLVNTLIQANREFSLNCKFIFMGGSSGMLEHLENYHVQSGNIEWLIHDFSRSDLPVNKPFTHAIHALTPSKNPFPGNGLGNAKAAAINSMQYLLDNAFHYGGTPNMVHLSSGAVYPFSHSPDSQPLLETNTILDKNVPRTEYAKLKLQMENLISKSTADGHIQGSNPRIFSLFGPLLPLGSHFALGNFMQNLIQGNKISILGNPLSQRSYLYMTDLITLLVRILVKPTIEPLNVGSSIPVTMQNVAKKVSELENNSTCNSGNLEIEVNSYFPSTENARSNYNFTQEVCLEDGLDRWYKWLK